MEKVISLKREISRVAWMHPILQAYMRTGDIVKSGVAFPSAYLIAQIPNDMPDGSAWVQRVSLRMALLNRSSEPWFAFRRLALPRLGKVNPRKAYFHGQSTGHAGN
jgi:hypothetical protein